MPNEWVLNGAHLLDEVDFVIVLAKAGANEFVILQTRIVAETNLLQGGPDLLEVGSELFRSIWARVGDEYSQAMCQEESCPGSTYDTSSNDANCFDSHCEEEERRLQMEGKRGPMGRGLCQMGRQGNTVFKTFYVLLTPGRGLALRPFRIHDDGRCRWHGRRLPWWCAHDCRRLEELPMETVKSLGMHRPQSSRRGPYRA